MSKNLIQEINKELEPLGFKHLGAFYWYYPYETYCNEYSNRNLSWRLNIAGFDKYIFLEAYERNEFMWSRMLVIKYNIEELKRYMKLMDIKPSEYLHDKNDQIFKEY